MLKRYLVDLTRRERTELLGLLNKGIAPARTLTRARILLAADEHKTDAEIAASPACASRHGRAHPPPLCRRQSCPRPMVLLRKRYCWRTGADFQSACGGRNRAPYDRLRRGAADVNVVVPTPMANMVHGLLRT